MKLKRQVLFAAAAAVLMLLACSPASTPTPAKLNCGLLGQPCPNGFTCTELPQPFPANNIREYCASADNRSIFVPAGDTWYGPVKHKGQEVWEPGDEVPRYPGAHLEQIYVETSAYVVLQYPVAFWEYQRCYEAGECATKTNNGTIAQYLEPVSYFEYMPVVYKSWKDAGNYCAYEAMRTGLPWRLCSDLEYEKASVGGCETLQTDIDAGQSCAEAQRLYPWGDAPITCHMVPFGGCYQGPEPFPSLPAPEPTGSRYWAASPYGLLNVWGGASVWMQDCTHEVWDMSGITGDRAWDFDCDEEFGSDVGPYYLVRGMRYDNGISVGDPDYYAYHGRTAGGGHFRQSLEATDDWPGITCCRDYIEGEGSVNPDGTSNPPAHSVD